ncbi:unnamed protein product, partial [Meganyctiphanes norvegica]
MQLSVGLSLVLALGTNFLTSFVVYHTFPHRNLKKHSLFHMMFLPLSWLQGTLHAELAFHHIVEQYLPECHNFIGGILVQINWKEVVAVSQQDSNNQVVIPSDENCWPTQLHTCLLKLLVRISMEPSVRQSSLLQTLLLDSEQFSWQLIDGVSFENVINWWVMSCDPRIVLDMDSRNPVDIAIIQLLHRAAGYTPDTVVFHVDTGAKRRLLLRAMVRLMTTAAARHKALLSARPQIFTITIIKLFMHMEATLVNTVPLEQQWTEGGFLSTEALALVTGGASSATLQEVASSALVTWLTEEEHSSPGLIVPFLATASHLVLHLNHRNPIIEASLISIFKQIEWVGWEGEITWHGVVSTLSFPLTNPSTMLSLAIQEGHILVVYAHTKWRRLQAYGQPQEDLMVLSHLCELLELIQPNDKIENSLILLCSEIVDMIGCLAVDGSYNVAVWQHSENVAKFLDMCAQDRSTSGLLAVIGLGRYSQLSLNVRLICRAISVFLLLQMPAQGVFRTHPTHKYCGEDEDNMGIGSDMEDLERLKALRTNSLYVTLNHALTACLDFIEDPKHCIQDTYCLLSQMVSTLMLHPMLRHLAPPSLSAKITSAPANLADSLVLNNSNASNSVAPSAPVLLFESESLINIEENTVPTAPTE